jgi:hypothetical protein
MPNSIIMDQFGQYSLLAFIYAAIWQETTGRMSWIMLLLCSITAQPLRWRDYSSRSMISPVKPDGEAIMKWNPSGPPHLRLSFSMIDRMWAGLSFGPET